MKTGRKAKSWRDHDMMWVLGCIDSNGAITANPTREGRTHRPEESRGRRWRWCIWSQEFCDVFQGEGITPSEVFTVVDWLIKHGYADDRALDGLNR